MYARTSYRSVADINDSMIRVYNHMFLAVANSMIVSYLISTSPTLMQFLFTGLMKWLVIFAPLAFILLLSIGMEKMTRGQALLALHSFATLMGVSFSTIFVVYTANSIFSAFMGAAVLFGTMSLYGYFTKSNLEGWGKFLLIGLIAIIIASIINIFIGSTALQMTISAIGILVFLGLTAYDTQQIRELVSVDHNGNTEVVGALTLYLDFINLFLSLLQLFGGRRDE